MSHLKKTRVIMLPTKEKAPIGKLLSNENVLVYNVGHGKIPMGIQQHLYFLSDEKIEEGNWFIDLRDKESELYYEDLYVASDTLGVELANKLGKKVIASTDSSLGLPKPSNSFIEKYIKLFNENKQIQWVNVEYERDYKTSSYSDQHQEWFDKLKVDKSNEITIKPIKDSWNREEVIELLAKYAAPQYFKIEEEIKAAKDWLDKNI